MNPILSKIFGGAGKNIIDSIGKTLDNLITNKEELAAAKLEAEKEVNRHLEAIESSANKELELILNDKDSARKRESEFVKATGHSDYMVWFLSVSLMVAFGFIVWHLIRDNVPNENRELVTNIVGIIEGLLISIYSYYFGSSMGSRLKDMGKK